MTPLKICLLGRFSVQRNEQELKSLHSGKVKELFCYLLLHRDRAHSREVLASHLWDECTTAHSKKYLRQALWHLHQSLQVVEGNGANRALQADSDCVRLSTNQDLSLDVAEFERGFAKAQGIAGEKLDEQTARSLREAVALYQGELLEGCYQDWCLYHRERLQNMYAAMLDKLMAYCELHRDFGGGLAFGEQLLREDAARERTYVQLMRMEYLAGDRAGALRRYQRCVAALKKELNVEPAKRTVELYEQIRADQLQVPGPPQGQNPAGPTENQVLPPLLNRLRRIRSLLLGMQDRVQQDIQAIDNALSIRNTRR